MAKLKNKMENIVFKISSENFDSKYATHDTGFFLINYSINKDINIVIEKIYFEGIPAPIKVTANTVSGQLLVMVSNKLLKVVVFASGNIGDTWQMDFSVLPSSKIYTPNPKGEVIRKSKGRADFSNIYTL